MPFLNCTGKSGWTFHVYCMWFRLLSPFQNVLINLKVTLGAWSIIKDYFPSCYFKESDLDLKGVRGTWSFCRQKWAIDGTECFLHMCKTEKELPVYAWKVEASCFLLNCWGLFLVIMCGLFKNKRETVNCCKITREGGRNLRPEPHQNWTKMIVLHNCILWGTDENTLGLNSSSLCLPVLSTGILLFTVITLVWLLQHIQTFMTILIQFNVIGNGSESARSFLRFGFPICFGLPRRAMLKVNDNRSWRQDSWGSCFLTMAAVNVWGPLHDAAQTLHQVW